MNWRWLRWEVPIIATLIAAGWVASALIDDPGYVLVAFSRFSLETSIWAGMALLLIGYLATRLVFWFVPLMLQPRASWRGWTKARGATRARSATDAGLLALAHGDAPRARKLLLAGADGAVTPLLNYLHAARAAQQMGDGAARDADLAHAAAVAPAATHTIVVTRAQLLIDQGAWEAAHTLLNTLHTALPRNPLVLQLLTRTGVRLRDHMALLGLAAALRKEKALPVDQIDALETEAARWCFEQIAEAKGDPTRRWQELNKPLRQSAPVIVAYARALSAADNTVEAERLLREAIDRTGDGSMLRAYAEVPADPALQLRAVERWLGKRADDATLLQTLGRIHARAERWPEARSAFEASLRTEQDPAASRRTELLRNQVLLRLPAQDAQPPAAPG